MEFMNYHSDTGNHVVLIEKVSNKWMTIMCNAPCIQRKKVRTTEQRFMTPVAVTGKGLTIWKRNARNFSPSASVKKLFRTLKLQHFNS